MGGMEKTLHSPSRGAGDPSCLSSLAMDIAGRSAVWCGSCLGEIHRWLAVHNQSYR